MAEIAIIVDENYNNLGIATYMVNLLIKLGKERGIEVFTAEVLFSNHKIIKVFKKACPGLTIELEDGVYSVAMPVENC